MPHALPIARTTLSLVAFMVKTHALTRRRMTVAVAVAILADLVQLAAGPAGWTFFDEIVDVIAMLIATRLLGFHWLLLPTFVMEFIPGAGMLPTWTGCVLLVIRIRNKQQRELQDTALDPRASNTKSDGSSTFSVG